jgi:hypothetical protein
MTAKKKNNLPDKTTIEADAAAKWMLAELEKQDGVLYQEDAASQIADRFGERFVYENESGNACIDRQVLAAFRKLTGESVVWISGERLWRTRELGDESTRQQK